jgi:hypothetical protein
VTGATTQVSLPSEEPRIRFLRVAATRLPSGWEPSAGASSVVAGEGGVVGKALPTHEKRVLLGSEYASAWRDPYEWLALLKSQRSFGLISSSLTAARVVPVFGPVDLPDAPRGVLTATASEPLAEIGDRLTQLSQLPVGWAGEGSISPHPSSLKIARRVISEMRAHLPVPQATASSEGEIGLTWVRDEGRLDAIIDPDGHLTWVSHRAGRYQDGQDLDVGAGAPLSPLFEAVADFLR